MKESVQEDIDKAWKEFKEAVWAERKSFLVLVIIVWSFLAGASIEHYWPSILNRLWM